MKSCTSRSTALAVTAPARFAKASWDLSIPDLLVWIRAKGWTVEEFKLSAFYERNKETIAAFRSI